MMPASLQILAALINPALLWGGMGAMSLPVIIHLLARRRFRRIRWAAMDFLIDAEKRNRRRVRIEELILLALRCLAILLIGLLVARPFVRPTSMGAIFGGAQRTERVFLLDDSLSMGYLSSTSSTFERAKTSLLNLLTRVRDQAPEDTVTILRSSRPDEPLVEGAILDDAQMELIGARLEAMQPSQLRFSTERCMKAATEQLQRDPEVLNAVVYVISDFQRVDWIDRSDTTGQKASLADPLKQWAGEQRSVRLVLSDVGDKSAENTAVTDLRPASRQIVSGVEARFDVAIGNYTPRALDTVELDVAVGQVAGASARVEQVPAGGTAHAQVPAVFERSGDGSVRVELPPDNLSADNVRWTAVQVSDAVRILVVSGEQSADVYNDETHLLVTALRPEGEVASGNSVSIITEAELDSAALDEYHLVILCNVYRVSEPAADALHRYVKDGGGLAIFLGDQVSDEALYNSTLFRDGNGLLPATLRGVISASETGVTLATGDYAHPVVSVFSGRDNPFLKQIRFYQYFALDPAMADDAEAADTDKPYRPSATVIARFNDNDGSPAIVERPFGKGRVMLFASSCDLEWNDWARDPSYVVALLEIAQYLARASDVDRTKLVGDPIELRLDPSRFESAVAVRPPGYPQQQEVDVTAIADDAGGMSVTWPQTLQAGVYSLLLNHRDGAEETRRFAVNHDPDESDLAAANEEELRHALAGVDVEYITGAAPDTDAGDQGRHELWPAFLLAAMAVLMLEQTLAWRFGQR